TSGAHRVDTEKVCEQLGIARLGRAKPDFVREHTGQVIGGVSPIAHPAPVPTYVDSSLRKYDEIWAAAGHPAAVFSTTYDELVDLTGAAEVEVN
ncbi:MAG TPA: YbaK/EbsC family protein, partial [Nocardioidaceae bacterium]|nr:YbaK/EbsC family protein [Nocardioidaceae bacterium]